MASRFIGMAGRRRVAVHIGRDASHELGCVASFGLSLKSSCLSYFRTMEGLRAQDPFGMEISTFK